MDVTPEVYRYDIARTKEAIANLERSPMTETDAALRRALVRQLEALQAGLARAEQERQYTAPLSREQQDERDAWREVQGAALDFTFARAAED